MVIVYVFTVDCIGDLDQLFIIVAVLNACLGSRKPQDSCSMIYWLPESSDTNC